MEFATASTSLQFHLEEIELLRKEIEYRSLQQAALERDVIIASAAIYAGLATLKATDIDPDLQQIAPLLWWIPFCLAIYARARFFSHDSTIRRLGSYIMKCESLINCIDHGGDTIVKDLRRMLVRQKSHLFIGE
jgi:hypothetical protein